MRLLVAAISALFLSVLALAPAQAAAVKVTVNGAEITDTQISLRAGLLRLERRGSSNSARLKMASDELVDEALMLQEAERLEIKVSDKDVSNGYLNVARNLKLSSDKLSQVLSSSGVNPSTLRDRIRASIAWQGVTQAAVMPRVQISELDLDEKASDSLTDTMSYDYTLKEILFILPQGKGSASKRTGEANQYRKNFVGCDNAVDLSLSYTDAAVLDVGRRHATQLPEALAKELAGLDVGGITKPRVAENGVSMLAICSKASARDLTFIKSDLRQEAGTEKLQEEATAYLDRLRERATINYR